MPRKGKTVHVVCNSHWDREWVYPYEETRLLLIKFMDELLDLLDRDKDFHSFLMDSQTLCVEDYLELRPEKRIYPVAQMPTTEAAIDYNLARDVYVVIGDAQNNGGWAVRTYIKPLTNWIWIGCALMALGGFLSLSDRRFRVAVGARQ